MVPTFVGRGSITLAAVARGLGVELSPDWIRARLGPLDAAGEALFVEIAFTLPLLAEWLRRRR